MPDDEALYWRMEAERHPVEIVDEHIHRPEDPPCPGCGWHMPTDPDAPTVACQLGSCGDCPDPGECTCTCHLPEGTSHA